MPFVIYVCDAVLEKMNLEPCLEQVFACVADAIFCSYSAYIHICRVEKFEDFAERLPSVVDTFKSRVLFDSLVAAFVECKLLDGVWQEILVDIAAAGAGNAVRRPDASLILE